MILERSMYMDWNAMITPVCGPTCRHQMQSTPSNTRVIKNGMYGRVHFAID